MDIDKEYVMEPYFEQRKERKKKRYKMKNKKTRMSLEQYKEIKRFLVKKVQDRRFYYFQDRYALMLLSYYTGQGKTVREIKQSPYAKLLNRPVVKEVLARSGKAVVTGDDLASVWPAMPECFTIGFGGHGTDNGYKDPFDQTSRPGMNLVVLLNYSNMHDSKFTRLVPKEQSDWFRSLAHPHARGRYTLAWTRVDIAADMSEALIEEVQNDWLRYVRDYLDDCADGWKPRSISKKQQTRIMRYAREVVGRYGPVW